MTYILKNKYLEIQIDSPKENYNFSRFDWTGKIVKVKFNHISLSSTEKNDYLNEHHFGKGFYNEFGMDTALGFEEAKIGDWFHKIGVGLLKKEDNKYLFNKNYKIKPAKFKVITKSNKIFIQCKSESVNGYSYLLKKEIMLQGNNFIINYELQNTGEKDIKTSEYAHNFMAINNELIGTNYVLKFPIPLKSNLFDKTVNMEQKVEIKQNEFKFNATPNKPFFFSNLSNNNTIDAFWELINLKSNIGISETGSFKTNKINLWGCGHVISPELFFNIYIKPNQIEKWSRTYNIFNLNIN
jgi:hypothetical protein